MTDEKIFTELTARYPELETCKEDIFRAARALIRCYRNHGKLLVCGNGGSAADAEHIVGELMKSFEQKRDLDKGTQERLRSADPTRGPLLAGKLQPGLPGKQYIPLLIVYLSYGIAKLAKNRTHNLV